MVILAQVFNIFKQIKIKQPTTLVPFLKNNFDHLKFSQKNTNTMFYYQHSGSFLKKIFLLCQSLLVSKKNVLFISELSNINYLPISNKILFLKTKSYFFKLLRYFRVAAIIIFDFNQRNFLLRRFLSTKCVTIVFNKKIKQSSNCIQVNCDGLSNSKLYKYVLYLMVLKFYKQFYNKYR